MKVALCLSGQPRFYSTDSYKSLQKHIIKPYSADVFIHSWINETNDYSCAPWAGISDCFIPSSVAEDLKNLYKPKKIVFEESREFPEYHSKNPSDYITRNAPSMFYSMTYCDKLRQDYEKEMAITYDWVIRARTDTYLDSFPDLTKLSPNILYVPSNCPNPNSWVYNDNFSICSGSIAHKIYSVYNTIETMYNSDEDDRSAILKILSKSAEDMWGYHLQINDTVVQRLVIYQTFVRDWNNRKDPIRLYFIGTEDTKLL